MAVFWSTTLAILDVIIQIISQNVTTDENNTKQIEL